MADIRIFGCCSAVPVDMASAPFRSPPTPGPCLCPNAKPSCAEELAADVQARTPAVNIATIYRNLDELERLKIVDRTRPGHGPATYHLASAAHGHLLCDKCGSMTEVPGEVFTDLARKAREGYGFTIAPHKFAVIGLCASCQ